MSATSAEDPRSSGNCQHVPKSAKIFANVTQSIATAASSSGTKGSAARTHRVARKRKSPAQGPPSLQWVIAQDPSEFKDEKTKRSVRSQAMIQYRYRARTDKKAQKEKIRFSSVEDAVEETSRGAVVDAVAVTTDAPLATPEWDGSDDQHQLFRAASAAVGIPNPSSSGLAAPWTRGSWSQGMPGWQTPGYRWSYTLQVLNSISLARRNSRKRSFAVSPEEQEEGVKRLINKSSEVALSPLGNPSEPFEVLPQFMTAELNRDGGPKECRSLLRSLVTSSVVIVCSDHDWHAGLYIQGDHGQVVPCDGCPQGNPSQCDYDYNYLARHASWSLRRQSTVYPLEERDHQLRQRQIGRALPSVRGRHFDDYPTPYRR